MNLVVRFTVPNYGKAIQRQICKTPYQAFEKDSKNGSKKKTNKESPETKEGHWHGVENCEWTTDERKALR
jgi:hypothetical protein